MTIQLPPLFEEKLQGHDHEKSIVFSALSSFGQWFESSGTPPFFRDYTDHGPKHITNVLATAEAMIYPGLDCPLRLSPPGLSEIQGQNRSFHAGNDQVAPTESL